MLQPSGDHDEGEVLSFLAALSNPILPITFLLFLMAFGSLGYVISRQAILNRAEIAQQGGGEKVESTTKKPEMTEASNTADFASTPSQESVSESIDVNSAISLIEDLYYFLSEKDFDSARQLYAPQLSATFSDEFFGQFARVTVENLRIVSQTPVSINFVGYNTYVYPDGSTQREERSYTVRKVDGNLKITASEFIRVIKFR